MIFVGTKKTEAKGGRRHRRLLRCSLYYAKRYAFLFLLFFCCCIIFFHLFPHHYDYCCCELQFTIFFLIFCLLFPMCMNMRNEKMHWKCCAHRMEPTKPYIDSYGWWYVNYIVLPLDEQNHNSKRSFYSRELLFRLTQQQTSLHCFGFCCFLYFILFIYFNIFVAVAGAMVVVVAVGGCCKTGLLPHI